MGTINISQAWVLRHQEMPSRDRMDLDSVSDCLLEEEMLRTGLNDSILARCHVLYRGIFCTQDSCK